MPNSKEYESIVKSLQEQILELIYLRNNQESLSLIKTKISNILEFMSKLNMDPNKINQYLNITTNPLNIKGDIVGRDKIIIKLNDYSPKEDERLSIESYLVYIKNVSDQLNLTGIGSYYMEPSQSPLKLSEVNINLDILDKIAYGIDQFGNEFRISLLNINETKVNIVGDWEIVPMKLFEFIDQNKKTAIVGEFGSGRSSTINRLFYLISSSLLNITFDQLDLVFLPNIRINLPIPININLNTFTKSSHFGGTARNLLEYLKENLSTFGNAYKPILQAITSGNAIFAFENLDIIDDSATKNVTDAIKDLCLIFPDNYFLITCRRNDFIKFNNTLHFMKADIAILSKGQIDDYIHNWHRTARLKQWKIEKDSEIKLLNTIYSSDLFSLARNPFLLAQIVILFNSIQKLPENILDIYSELVKLLLIKWENPLSNEKSLSTILNVPNLSFKTIEAAIYELSFITFCEQEFRNIPKIVVLDTFQKHLSGNWGYAQIICEYIESKHGVIIKQQDNTFLFLTPKIHEFLVAKYISFQNDLSSMFADLILSSPLKWKNILLLTIRLVGTERGLSILNSLCYDRYSIELMGLFKDNKNRLQAILLASRAVCEIDFFEINLRPERLSIYKNITSWIEKIVHDDDLFTIEDRAEAANIISKLNHNQKGITTLSPLFRKISNSHVFINSLNQFDEKEMKYEISYDFWICVYPITQAQYAYFIEENIEYHIPEGSEDYNWSKSNRKPNTNLLNHPVVLVSWFDCLNYCKWLNIKLKNELTIPDDYEIRLPTMAEWEMAFKGGVVLNDNKINPDPHRHFPWGNEEGKNYANLNNQTNSFLGTTYVGLYNKGCSPYGIYDMLGNAMEWTNTSWGSFDSSNSGFSDFYNANDGRENFKAEGLKILRGGSWLFLENLAKCSCRLNPNAKFPDVGMRLVIGPKLNL